MGAAVVYTPLFPHVDQRCINIGLDCYGMRLGRVISGCARGGKSTELAKGKRTHTLSGFITNHRPLEISSSSCLPSKHLAMTRCRWRDR
jgi:hypothetical protein